MFFTKIFMLFPSSCYIQLYVLADVQRFFVQGELLDSRDVSRLPVSLGDHTPGYRFELLLMVGTKGHDPQIIWLKRN